MLSSQRKLQERRYLQRQQYKSRKCRLLGKGRVVLLLVLVLFIGFELYLLNSAVSLPVPADLKVANEVRYDFDYNEAIYDWKEEDSAARVDSLMLQLEESLKPYQTRYFRDLFRKTHNDEFRLDGAKSKGSSKPIDVWDSFAETLSKALDDENLQLIPYQGETREDGSIFISIASYRDYNCPDSLQMAFERALNPDLLYAGVVQQNCANDACMTGTGWAETRAWVPAANDIDCFDSFCSRPSMKKYCERNVRGLRLPEHQAYGPFFSRFLNSLMYRGENFYLQIDAHTEFRSEWDADIREQMRNTASYPFSVISNYPPAGGPFKNKDKLWKRSTLRRPHTPSALCGCKFEGAGGRHKTVRLEQTGRHFDSGVDVGVPHKTSFIAAGFFIAHGSFVKAIPFDPFMPYLFMGEEIALSIRFWTHGYDIYGPTEDVLKHEYVRKESPKFWESVNMIFSGPLHNGLTDLIIPRVLVLMGVDRDVSIPQSVFVKAEDFSVGNKRSVSDFLSLVGIDTASYTQTVPEWCRTGRDY